MKADVIDFHPDTKTLESVRGLQVGELIVLPDPFCPEGVIVRLRSRMVGEFSILRVGEMEITDKNIREAFDNHLYNQGWLGANLRPRIEKAAKITTKGS